MRDAVRRADPVTLAAGVVVLVLGVLLLLDAGDVVALSVDYAGPAVLAAVGVVLLVLGLDRSR